MLSISENILIKKHRSSYSIVAFDGLRLSSVMDWNKNGHTRVTVYFIPTFIGKAFEIIESKHHFRCSKTTYTTFFAFKT